MSTFPDYLQYDAVALAAMVADGRIHPRELVTEAIERVEESEADLNAITFKRYDRALAEAEKPLPESPLAGVPFLVKNLGQTVAGATSTLGSRMLEFEIADHDSNLVKRHKAAGLLIVGLTNSPEFGTAATTEPELHGPTRNPWNLSYSPGGSSGGAAAAVAGGYVPIAHASDGGGSIRIPAAMCGLFGLKPTRARTPKGPDTGEGWFGLSVDHAVSITVRDSAALLDLTHGPDPGAPYSPAPPSSPYLDDVGQPPGVLRIAVSSDAMLGSELASENVAAVEATAGLLEELGHEVTVAKPSVDKEQIGWAGTILLAADVAAGIERAAEAMGKKPNADLFEATNWLFGVVGNKISSKDLAQGLHVARMVPRSVAPFFDDYDILVESTIGRTPWLIGELEPTQSEATFMKLITRLPNRRLIRKALKLIAAQAFENIPNTPLWNITGQPSMSVPLHTDGEGLPLGIQFTSRYGEEGTLFRLAAQLESAAPWRDRRPGRVEA